MSKGPFDKLALKFTEELFRNTKTIETEEVRNKEFEIKNDMLPVYLTGGISHNRCIFFIF